WGGHLQCEFAVELEDGEDPDIVFEDGESFDDAPYGSFNKIGGTPDFLQGAEFPQGDGWRLLLQLDSTPVPLDIDFGDAGMGYAFLSRDGTRGKFVWQCY